MGAKLTKSEPVSISAKATDATTNAANRPAAKTTKFKPSKERKVAKITVEKSTNTDGYVLSPIALEEHLVGDRPSTDNQAMSTHTTTAAHVNGVFQPEIVDVNDVDGVLVHSGMLPMEFHLRHEQDFDEQGTSNQSSMRTVHRDDARPTME